LFVDRGCVCFREHGGVSDPRPLLHGAVGSGRRDPALRHPPQPAQKCHPGDPSPDRHLLLALLALLLHVTDEPSDWTNPGHESPLRHEARVGIIQPNHSGDSRQ